MSILQMSLQAGVLIAAIVVFRAFALYKLPKSSFLVLWGVVLARMLIPFSFASKFSAYNFLDVFKIFQIFTARKKPGATLPVGGAVPVWQNPARTPGPWGNAAVMEQKPSFSLPPLTALWIGVMMLLLVASCLLLARSYWILRDAVPMENSRFAGFVEKWTKENRLFRPLRVLQSDRIASPASHGILRPCIIFPRHMDRDMGVDRGNARMLEYILFHEYVHIRRFDTLWKLTALCAACVHWFNPLAWVMLFLLNRDLEISCDEMVLRHFGAANRGAYARSLIGMAGRKGPASFIQNQFCKKAAEERIIAVMKYKKFSVLATVFAMILVVGLSAAFTTTAKADAPVDDADYTEVPCVHDWKHGTDLMLGDTLIGCHGYDDRGGYTAIYDYVDGIVEPAPKITSSSASFVPYVVEREDEVSCVHGWKHGTDFMDGDTLISCHGYDDRGGYTAIYEEDGYAVMPCYDLCECGGSRRMSTVWTDIWRDYEEIPCPHYPHGTDTRQRMQGILIIECSSCLEYSETPTYRYRTKCGGYTTSRT